MQKLTFTKAKINADANVNHDKKQGERQEKT